MEFWICQLFLLLLSFAYLFFSIQSYFVHNTIVDTIAHSSIVHTHASFWFPKKKRKSLVTHPSTDHSQCCLTFLIKRENARRRANAAMNGFGKKLWLINVGPIITIFLSFRFPFPHGGNSVLLLLCYLHILKDQLEERNHPYSKFDT